MYGSDHLESCGCVNDSCRGSWDLGVEVLRPSRGARAPRGF